MLCSFSRSQIENWWKVDVWLMFWKIDFRLTTQLFLSRPSQFQIENWWQIDVWLMLRKYWFLIDNWNSALLAVTISNWQLVNNWCLIDVDERLIYDWQLNFCSAGRHNFKLRVDDKFMFDWCWWKIDFDWQLNFFSAGRHNFKLIFDEKMMLIDVEEKLIFTCGEAMQVNKLFFSFSLSSKFSIFWKMTIYYPLNVPDVTSVARCDQLVSDLTNWFQMWPIVARCDQLFPSVTSVKVWPAVAMCDQEWPTGFRCKQVVKFVPRCCQVWLTVARCDQLVSDVTSWSKLWPAGARCDKLLPCEQITRFCPVWPAIARYDFIVYFEITLLFITKIVDILYYKGARALKDFGSWFHQEGCI